MDTPIVPNPDLPDFAIEVLVHRLEPLALCPAMLRASLIRDSKLLGLRLQPDGSEWRLTSPDARCLGLALLDLAAMTDSPDYLVELPGPRMLPTVTLEGRQFFLDERLGELRAKDDPAHRLQLQGGVFY